jgi:hypothetical protein
MKDYIFGFNLLIFTTNCALSFIKIDIQKLQNDFNRYRLFIWNFVPLKFKSKCPVCPPPPLTTSESVN